MVEYGESLLLITNVPVDSSKFLFNSLDLSKDPKRYKLFHDLKEAWLRWAKLSGNESGDEEFYEISHGKILDIQPWYTPLFDPMHLELVRNYKPSKEFLSNFGEYYVYNLDAWNIRIFYDTNSVFVHDIDVKVGYFPLIEECGKDVFSWIIDDIKERLNEGNAVNKLVHCNGGMVPDKYVNNSWSNTDICDCIWIDLDIDKIEIPDDSFKYFYEEFKKRGVEFSGYNFGINFYKGSKT